MIKRLSVAVVLATVVTASPAVADSGHARPAKVIDEEHCVTDPVPEEFIPADVAARFALGSPVFGDDALWSVAADRSWFEDGGMGDPDGVGVAGLKLGWYRRERGHVEVAVEMLPSTIEQVEANTTWDPADGTAWVPDGYGLTGFQVSGIEFPDHGCWMITGELVSPDDGPRRMISMMSFLIWVPKPAAPSG